MDIQASIVINWPAEAVFAYLASEEHIAVLGQQVEYEQEAGEGSPEESRPQSDGKMEDGGGREGEGKPRPYIYIPMIVFKLKMGRPRPQEGATGAAVFEFGSAAGGEQGQQGEATLLESKTVLEPVAGGTLVTGTMYSDEGCYKLIAPFVAPDTRRQLQEGLREMKKELEEERD